MNVLDCATGKVQNFSQSDCGFTFQEIAMVIGVTSGVKLAWPVTEAAITTLIQEKRAFPIPVLGITDNSAEAITEEVNNNLERVKEGETRWNAQVKANPCNWEAMKSFRGLFAGVFLIDKANRIGCIMDEVNSQLIPLPVNQFYPNPKPLGKFGVESPKYTFDLYMDTETINNQPFGYLKPDPVIIFPNNIDGLKDVDITSGGVNTTTSIVVNVLRSCGKTPVHGLVKDDFLVTGTGSMTISTVTDNGKGKYTLDGTFAAGEADVSLSDPKDQAAGVYETRNSLKVTIS